MIDKTEIGKRIRYARTNARDDRPMTQADLAKSLGCSRDTVRNWETGRVLPDNEKLKKIAYICHVDWRWLLLGDVVNGYTDEFLKDIMVDSARILASFNPLTEDEQFKNALFRVIESGWGIGMVADTITDKEYFYNFMKEAIIKNIYLYMNFINPLKRKDDQK